MMSNWCVNCGEEIPLNTKYCPFCRTGQGSSVVMDLKTSWAKKRAYKKLEFKQATEGLTNDEKEDMDWLRQSLD